MWMRLAQWGGARSIQARQAQHHGLAGPCVQRALGLEQAAAIEAQRAGGRMFVHPLPVVLAVDGRGRDEQRAAQGRRVQRVAQVAQAIDENLAIAGRVVRAGGRQVDDLGQAVRQAGQCRGLRQVGGDPAQPAILGRRRLAPQRPDLVAARQQAPRHAHAQVAAAGQQHSFAHARPPPVVDGHTVWKKGAARAPGILPAPTCAPALTCRCRPVPRRLAARPRRCSGWGP
ncbi:Uncharacterised protein [Bordetella pertussis]|nr:Uncharacterised protein [Bordetella pertussis]